MIGVLVIVAAVVLIALTVDTGSDNFGDNLITAALGLVGLTLLGWVLTN